MIFVTVGFVVSYNDTLLSVSSCVTFAAFPDIAVGCPCVVVSYNYLRSFGTRHGIR